MSKIQDVLEKSIRVIVGSDHSIVPFKNKQRKSIAEQQKKRCKGLCNFLKSEKTYKRFSLTSRKCIVCNAWYDLPVNIQKLQPNQILFDSNDYCSCCGFILQFNSKQVFDVDIEHNYQKNIPLSQNFPTDEVYINYDLDLLKEKIIQEKLYLLPELDDLYLRFKYLRYDYFIYLLILLKNQRLLVPHIYEMVENTIKQEKNRQRFNGINRYSINCFDINKMLTRFFENFLFQSLMFQWHEEEKISLTINPKSKYVANPSQFNILDYTMPFSKVICCCKFHSGVDRGQHWIKTERGIF